MFCFRTLRKSSFLYVNLSRLKPIFYQHLERLSSVNRCRAPTIVETKFFRTFSSQDSSSTAHEEVSIQLYEKISQEALENLADVFDQLLEEKFNKEYDVSLSNGVLTVQLENIGTYVINKQTPNRQLWLSSPSSGPKRFDYINHKWIYLHDFCTLDDILSNELSGILGEPVRIISN